MFPQMRLQMDIYNHVQGCCAKFEVILCIISLWKAQFFGEGLMLATF